MALNRDHILFCMLITTFALFSSGKNTFVCFILSKRILFCCLSQYFCFVSSKQLFLFKIILFCFVKNIVLLYSNLFCFVYQILIIVLFCLSTFEP